MKKIFFISALGLLIVFFGKTISFKEKQTIENKLEEKSKPFDHFYFQRSFPEITMDYKAYNSTLEEIKTNISQKKSGITSDWTLEGPTNIGGRINAVEVDPTNPNIIYVGTAAGGVFKTTNGGNTWNPIGDDFAYLAISDITIDPNSPTTIYVGTGDLNISGLPNIGNGIYKSIDGGNSWQHMGLSDECIISRVVVDPSNSNIIYASAMGRPFIRNNNRGLYKSIDGGSSWLQILFLSNETGVIDLVMDPFNSNTLYCSGWDRIRTNQESLISGNGARVWKTIDGGNNWSQLSGGLPLTKLSRIGLDISEQTPNLIFASVVDSTHHLEAIYKSTNAGVTWSPIGDNGLNSNVMGGFGWYFGQVRVSPYNDNEISILGVEMYSTFDGGNNWQKSTPDWWTYQVHADCHDMVYINAGTILLATDGGLYKTNNGMASWSDIENLPNTQFYRIAINPHQPGVYAGGAQDNGTTSGNVSTINNWPREYGGDGFQTIYDPINPNLRYYETQNGGLAYNDGFTNAFDAGIDPTDRRNWDMPFIMSSFNSSTLYTGTYRIYKHVNAPYNVWSAISPDLTDGVVFGDRYHNISTVAESPTNQLHLYAGTSDGNVWRTLNGSSWVNITGTLPNRYVTSIVGSPSTNNTVFVAHSGYKYNDFIPHIHKSLDNGTNWIDISGDLPQIAINNVLVYPNSMDSIVFVATDAGVYFTSNSGVNWNRVGGNMPLIPVMDIDLDVVNNKLVAGTFARSIQSFPLDSLFPEIITTTQLASNNAIDISIFPNPTSNFISIVGIKTKNKVVIYNMIGEVVKTIVVSNKQKIDVSELKQGGYFIQVQREETSTTIKMIKK